MGAVDLSSYIWTEADRGIQPPSPVPLDTNNPLVRGLVSVINPAWRDAKLSSTGSGAQHFKVGPEGVKFVTNNAGLLIKDISPIAGSATILHFGPLGVLGGSYKAASGLGNNISATGGYFFIASATSSASGIKAYIRPDLITSAVDLTAYSKAGNVDNLTDDVWVAVYNETSDFRIYRNGVNDTASVAVKGTPMPIAGMRNHSIGGVKRPTNYYGYTGSACYLGLAWNRALSDAEIKSISDNPWQVFQPIEPSFGYLGDLSTGWATSLTIADAMHPHTADELLLSWNDLLTVQAADHAQSADNLGLSTDWLLTVQESTHAHTADNLALSTRWLLAVQEALHAHAADNIGLSATGSASLSVQDSTHGHLADALTLVTTWLLSVADSTHGHAADNLTLDTSNVAWLAVQEALHAHSADSVALTLNTWLAIVDAAHAHYADSLTLTADATLTIAQTLHAIYSDTLVLSLPGATSLTPDDIQSIAAAVLAALQATPIPVDLQTVKGQSLKGDGSEANPWNPA